MLNWSRVVSRIAGLVKQSSRTAQLSACQLSRANKCQLILSSRLLATSRSRTRQNSFASLQQPYHTRAHAKYADIAPAEDSSAQQSRATLVQQQLERAHSLVSEVELGGENAAESAREAVEILTRMLAHEQLDNDERARCLDGAGLCYNALGEHAAAEQVLAEGVAAHPQYAPLWLHLGEAMQQQGRHVDAIGALSKFVEQSKEFYHITQQQYEDGAVSYQYTLRQRIDSVQLLCAAFFKRAVSYIRVQEETMALTDLWLIVDTAHSPQWTARAYLAIAQLARLRGDWHQARSIVSKAIDAAAGDTAHSPLRSQLLSQAHHLRAVCYEALDDDSRAEQDHVLADFYFRETAFKR